MGTGSAGSLFKSLVAWEMKAAKACGGGVAGWRILLKGRLTYCSVSLRPWADMTFQEKKKEKKKSQRGGLLPFARRQNFQTALRRAINGPAGVWLMCNWIGTHLKKVFWKYLEVMVSRLDCLEPLNCPHRCCMICKTCSDLWAFWRWVMKGDGDMLKEIKHALFLVRKRSLICCILATMYEGRRWSQVLSQNWIVFACEGGALTPHLWYVRKWKQKGVE